jgi:D-alanyl-lipoteichoic acid acyltransferase DltB (MBOAT superfamily)
MLFNSWIFPPFLALVLILYRVLPHRGQNLMLLGASWLFYGWWDWRFLSLLLVSTTVDFVIARAMHAAESPARRRRLLQASLAFNLGLLGFFKYFNFFADSASALLTGLGLPGLAGRLDIVLPVGISFYTFQEISYVVDVYRGTMKPAARWLDYALYVAFFPHLVAGPIQRTDLLPQIENPRTVTSLQVREGAWLVLTGLFKKMVIADSLAEIVDGIFARDASALHGPDVLVAVYGFAYQIYCDFSGYSDIARGVAKWLGVELMVNFNRPYLAHNPSEFWTRWHISLSTWLRDYLYIPLGGNRGTRWQTCRNLLVTMVLGGLWHGAAWTFVLWGLYHGLLLVGHRLLFGNRRAPEAPARLAGLVSRILMFQAACYGWLLFRAASVGQVVAMTQALGRWLIMDELRVPLFLAVVLVGMLWTLELWSTGDDPRASWGWSWGVGALACSLMIVAIVLLTPPSGRSFVYFQF